MFIVKLYINIRFNIFLGKVYAFSDEEFKNLFAGVEYYEVTNYPAYLLLDWIKRIRSDILGKIWLKKIKPLGTFHGKAWRGLIYLNKKIKPTDLL